MTQGRGARPSLPVGRRDFKQNAPLLEQGAIRRSQAVSRIVDARPLRRHSVELYHLEVPARPKVVEIRCLDVVAAEEKSFVALADTVNRGIQVRGANPRPIKEEGPPRVSAYIDQLDGLSCRGDCSQFSRVPA